VPTTSATATPASRSRTDDRPPGRPLRRPGPFHAPDCEAALTDVATSFPEDAGDPEDFSLSALRIIFFTGFAIVATVLGFVFLPLAGFALAALIAWKGFDGLVWVHRDFALRALSMVALTAFAVTATVMGFVFLPPAGVVLAGLFLWRGFGALGFARTRTGRAAARPEPARSGNAAFDAYRTATLRRLEEEQESFLVFLQRLRDAKDKSEFDAFMADRRRPAPKLAPKPAPKPAVTTAPDAEPADPWGLGRPVMLARPDPRPGLPR
jgi:hypothetical protein